MAKQMVEYSKKFELPLITSLEKCLPQSGRVLDIRGRHSFYLDIANQFKVFWCLFEDEKIIGTVAVKELDEENCELKSLYLLEEYHGLGYGKAMLEKAVSFAKEVGYHRMYLDSLSTSTKALGLYSRVGFVDTERYNQNVRSDVFMVLELHTKCEE